ncbi:hypothetical protein HYDPIDRAFT_39032 [Hydnomerulius pinastri MD-312]|nr:hypothetical protein HYDPIDRAFT_39032 [Hydnomerulius pinastri MD-312]
MVRRRRRLVLLSLLSLGLLWYKWFTSGIAQAIDDGSRSLAENAVAAAQEAVHEEVMKFVNIHEDGGTSRKIDHSISEPSNVVLRYRLQKLQTSLDGLLITGKGPPHSHSGAVQERYQPPRIGRYRAPETHLSKNALPIHHENVTSTLCASLAGKRISMIGGEHVYKLHKYLLQFRERAEGKTFRCSYREFCTHHHICLPPAVATPFGGSQEDIPRYVKSPTPHQLVETESALVNYIISDTLFSSRDESSWQYTVPFLDHSSGIRLHETYWLPAARKAGIVILGHGPMSAPGETYAGNWSFLDGVQDYINKTMTGSEEQERNNTSIHRELLLNHGPLDIVNAAVHFTVSKFLPDVLQVLKSTREEVRPGRRKRLIWASSWYHLPGRGSARTALLNPHRRSNFMSTLWNTRSAVPPERLDVIYQVGAFLDAESMGTSHTEDPWTLFHNTQVFLQNCVLRELLPRHGITFLPLNIPWSEYVHFHHSSIVPRSLPEDIEYGRSEAIGEAFLTGFDHILRYLD